MMGNLTSMGQQPLVIHGTSDHGYRCLRHRDRPCAPTSLSPRIMPPTRPKRPRSEARSRLVGQVTRIRGPAPWQ